MKCQNCGYESKNLEYCPVCGEKIEGFKEEVNEEPTYEEKIDEKVEPKVESNASTNKGGVQYKVFAIIGYVLGLSSLILVWVPYMFFDSIPGMIFSKVGDKPTNKQQFAKKGFTLSLIATIINVIWTILFYVIIIAYVIEVERNY